jgi:FkbM family methyltransferase
VGKIKNKIKKLILEITGRFSHLKKGIICKHIWYGNTYGGFYIYPELLDENTIVYSFGIGEDISFDNAIIEKHNCKVFGFDPTPKSINWIANQKTNPNFQFYGFGLDSKSGFVDFYLPINDDHVSGSLLKQTNVSELKKVSVEMKSFKDIVEKLGHKNIDVLKMDIEGSEYEVLDSILDSKVSITQILIEFHERFFADGKDKTIDIIKKMRKNGYEIFAISDSFEEVSFIKKSVL